MEIEINNIALYSIVDVETTGGKFNEEGITEIAIYKFDGNKIIDQFISLINPEIPIQPFVQQLTGINNKMLRNAPKFFQVAKRILEITENTVLVAQNSSFDYRMLRTEFKRLGFDFYISQLCTVRMSKKLIPNMKSYKLGNLVKSLGIHISNRHRASGDALATTELFKLLLFKDQNKEIINECIQLVREKIGPVAAFKKGIIVERLPKTRSGKILRGIIVKIADGEAYKAPATIDDPKILDEITLALNNIGYPTV